MSFKPLKSLSINLFRKGVSPSLKSNTKIIAQFALTSLFIALGVVFIKNEHSEIINVKNVLTSANLWWLLAGVISTVLYIFLQGQMYVYSFASVRLKVSLGDATRLFIKRNFVSVFLPAGGISSLAFFTNSISDKSIKKSQIHFASSIYGFVGILTVVVVAIPAFIYSNFNKGSFGASEWYALLSIVVLMVLLIAIFRSIRKKGYFFSLLIKLAPEAEVFINDLQEHEIDNRQFLYTVIISTVIEVIGIAQVYIAMIALGIAPSLSGALMGYIISVVFLIISPFLRGLGPVEVSMTYILIQFGFNSVDAIAITLIYRFFEFWLPLVVGALVFVSKVNKFLLRIFPALFLVLLGVFNIISVLTPTLHSRMTLLRSFLPPQFLYTSDFLVVFAGLFSLVTATYMLKGLKTAWWFALFLSILSFAGNLTKGINYSEAIFALFVVATLIFTRKQYIIKSDPKLKNVGILTALLVMLAVFIYGILGFYLLDKNHFNIDFSFVQSWQYTLQNYFLIKSEALIPHDRFSRFFLLSINASGFLSITFLIYTFVRSFIPHKNVSDEEFLEATQLIKSYGNSALDYFKTYSDKMIFFSKSRKAFLSYRISGHFAVVLEAPVASDNDEMSRCIEEFDKYCYQNGLNNIYYRVPAKSLDVYTALNKKTMFIGQEAVVDLTAFSMTGNSKKSLRNALNKIKSSGYTTTVHMPPVKDGVVQKLKLVSDEWLEDTGRKEIVFSQGMFNWDEIKNQEIITVESEEEKIVAFLNIIPDSVQEETTYDLMRKTKDAPNGVMDFILIALFDHAKSRGYRYVNLGFAPISVDNETKSFPEKTVKFAYNRIKALQQHKGIRDYKQKFDPEWNDRYLVYDQDYDLFQVPTVLAKVIKS